MRLRATIPAVLVCCGLATLVLGGCTAAIQGYPETKPDKISAAESSYYLSNKSKSDYMVTPSQKLRDGIIDAHMLVIDRNFREFEKSLYQEGLELGLGVDWLVLALAGATATVGGETVKAALGAISAGVVGAKSSFDKRAFMEKSLTGILAQMKAQRAVVELSIRTQQRSGIDGYRLRQALLDVGKYYDAGALPTALNGIIQEASAKTKEAQAELKIVLDDTYQSDNASNMIRSIWKPDGKTINAANKAKIYACMTQEKLATGPGTIPGLITSKTLAPARLKVVKCLTP